MTLSLSELVSAARSGELSAFTELVRRFQDMAVGFAYARLGDRALAEDVAQEAFVATFRALGQLREPAAFPVWFKRILSKHVDRVQRVKIPDTLRWESATSEISGEAAPPEADPFERLAGLERSQQVLGSFGAP